MNIGDVVFVQFIMFIFIVYMTALEEGRVEPGVFFTRVLIRTALWPFLLLRAIVSKFPEEFARIRKEGW